MGKASKCFYEFGHFRMDPSRKLLLRDGEPVTLTSKAFEMLLLLVERSEQVVSKDELMKALWPDSFVEESNLTQHISILRKALGETPQDHRYILTFPSRGYRFAESVRVVTKDGVDLAGENTTLKPGEIVGPETQELRGPSVAGQRKGESTRREGNPSSSGRGSASWRRRARWVGTAAVALTLAAGLAWWLYASHAGRQSTGSATTWP